MFSLLENAVQPLAMNMVILEAAYELYLEAPQADYPVISLRDLSRKTGASLLECRNTIVTANKAGKFPNCTLFS